MQLPWRRGKLTSQQKNARERIREAYGSFDPTGWNVNAKDAGFTPQEVRHEFAQSLRALAKSPFLPKANSAQMLERATALEAEAKALAEGQKSKRGLGRLFFHGKRV